MSGQNKRSSLVLSSKGGVNVRKQVPKENLFKSKFQEKYILGSQTLGSGAYATVKLGMCKADSTRVAVKIIAKSKMRVKDIKKVESEVKILKTVQHENVISLYDAYADKDNYYIVMEYAPDGDLLSRIAADETFSENKAREIIEQIVLGLLHCKEKGIVHRDVKPENVLIGEDGKVKLADFNLSKKISVDEIEFSLLETECGTPNFVAPEVLRSRPYSYKCDVWSTGVILFVILSGGFLPFFPNDRRAPDVKRQLLEKVASGKWSFQPEESWANVSEEGKDLVSHMLVKNPDERFTYEQILKHEWFLPAKLDVQKNIIDMKTAKELKTRIDDMKTTQLLAKAKQVYDAVETFRDIMLAEEIIDADI